MRDSKLLFVVAGVVVVLCALAGLSAATVAGIDLGSEHFKVVVVRPGSLDVALNEASGRKSATAVGFTNDERLVGDLAASQATKTPFSVFTHFVPLLGRQIDPESAWFQEMKSQLPWLEKAKVDPETQQLEIVRDESTSFSLEEVLAQVLSYAGQIAASSAGHAVRDVSITVPNYFTQAQRQAVLDSAKLANLNVLALMNQGAALALQYGIERTFEKDKPQYVLFYDMGSTDLQVSLYKFSAVAEKKGKPVAGAHLVAQAWDESLGGRTFDQKLVEHYVEELKQKGKTLDSRGLVKLQRAVKKAKEILSANKEFQVSVESIVGEYDFRSTLTRDLAEDLWAPLFERALEPLKKVLAAAQLDASQIDAIEIFGGSVRIPKLQATLAAYLKRDQLDKHLNGDEAAVFGVALHGASVSAQHRTREFRLKDAQLSHFPVLVTKETADEALDATPVANEESSNSQSSTSQNHSGEEDADAEDPAGATAMQIKNWTLFKPTSHYNAKRTLKFAGFSNFTINLAYGSGEGIVYAPGTILDLATYEISGIPQLEQYNLTSRPLVNVKFSLSQSGLVSLNKAFANISYTILKTVEVPKPKAKTETETETEPTTTTTTEAASTSETAPVSEEQEKKEEEAPKVEEVEEKEIVVKTIYKTANIPLKVKTVKEIGLSPAKISAGLKKLQQIDELERMRKETAKAKNAVESFVYDTRDKLYSSEVEEMSTAEEREEVSAYLSAASEWLDDEGFDATKQIYQDKLRDLQTKADKIMIRVREATARPQAVEACLAVFNLTRAIAENITTKFEVTDDEKENLITKVDETEKWLNETIANQDQLKPFEDPVVMSADISKRCQDIQFRVRVLLKRPIRKPAKKPKVVPLEEKQPEQQAEPQPEAEQPTEAEPAPEAEQPQEQETSETTNTNTDEEQKKDEL